jgi:hypothetical protein
MKQSENGVAGLVFNRNGGIISLDTMRRRSCAQSSNWHMLITKEPPHFASYPLKDRRNVFTAHSLQLHMYKAERVHRHDFSPPSHVIRL